MSSASFLLTANFLLLIVTFSSSFAVDLWQRRDLNNASFERIHFTDEEIHRFNEDNAKFHPADDDDRETSHDFGEFMAEFFHGSSSQLIVDLDLLRELWTELEKAREAAAAGDVDHIQAIMDYFEPIREYDISAPCLADLFHFLLTTYNYAQTASIASKCTNCSCTGEYRNKVREIQWIFDVVDAMGKIPAALVTGNNLWTGSWQTCRKIKTVKNFQGQLWQGQYCMSRFRPYEKHNPLKAFSGTSVDPTAICRANGTVFESFDDWTAEEKKCFEMMPLLNLGLCTPDTCTDYDVRKIIQFIYTSVELALGKKLVCDVQVKCSNSRPENQVLSHASSRLVLCFLLLIASLMFFGTFYDSYIHRPMEMELSRMPTDGRKGIEKVLKRSKTVVLVRLFSVSRNLRYILDTSTDDGQIRCLHGLRFFSMSWIIIAHSYYYIATTLTTDNLLQTLQDFPTHLYNQIVLQAPLSVDSFFFLSGLLTAYIFLKKLQKQQFRLNSLATWFAYIFRRYLRLTPVYVVIMILELTIFPNIFEGPFWRPIEASNCKWWANVLYVNNFIDQSTACLGWTWYLANDFQLYLAAPILLISLHKYKVGGVILGIAVIIVTSIIHLVIAIEKNYPPAPLLTSKLQIVGILADYWTDLYIKPYIRCGPYIIGCIAGYYLIAKKSKATFQLSNLQWMAGWTLGILAGIYSVFGLYNYSKTGEVSNWWSWLYTLVGRLSFSICLGWITFACETNYGKAMNAILGHKMFIPLSKLTFCAYLLHPILLQLYYFSRPTAFHFTHTFQLLHMSFAAIFMSYLSSLVVTLAFELPVMHIDRLLFGGGGDGNRNKTSRQKQDESHSHAGNNVEQKHGIIASGEGENAESVVIAAAITPKIQHNIASFGPNDSMRMDVNGEPLNKVSAAEIQPLLQQKPLRNDNAKLAVFGDSDDIISSAEDAYQAEESKQ